MDLAIMDLGLFVVETGKVEQSRALASALMARLEGYARVE